MGKITDLVAKMLADDMPHAAIINAVRQAEDGPVRNLKTEFDTFWRAYPSKVGKGAAEKAYAKARRLADAGVLLDGVMRYAAKRDDRPWCNPATFLNQRRWEDEPSVPTGRGIAGVRARLETEIANGRPDLAYDDRDALGGLSLFSPERH